MWIVLASSSHSLALPRPSCLQEPQAEAASARLEASAHAADEAAGLEAASEEELAEESEEEEEEGAPAGTEGQAG